MPVSASSSSSTIRPGAELDDHVATGLAGRADDVDDDDVAVHRRSPLHRGQVGHRMPERLELGVDELGRHCSLGSRHLERLPVRQLHLRLHGDGGREREGRLRRLGQVVLVVRLRDGVNARRRRGRAEPAADVARDRLVHQPFLADARDEHLHRHLAFAKAGDLDCPGQVGRGVVDSVLEVMARHLHREADLVFGEPFDRRVHAGHSTRTPFRDRMGIA